MAKLRLTLMVSLLIFGFHAFAQTPCNWTAQTGSVVEICGNVGIGTANPTVSLHVATESLNSPRGIIIQGSLNTNNSPMLVFRRTRGTILAPVTIQSGDNIGTLYAEAYDGTTYHRTGTGFKFVSSGVVATGNIPTDMLFTSGSSGTGIEHMRLTAAGNVGIGTGAPTSKLHVVGNVTVTGDITGARVFNAVYQDLAEWVPAAENLEPGTVVVLDPTQNNQVMASGRAYDSSVAGVVSAQPGVLLGVAAANKEQIATTGRVRVRVDARSAPIAIGDLLVTSDRPGTAMKSQPVDLGGVPIHRPGTIIGKALEPLPNGEGEILVLLSLQ